MLSTPLGNILIMIDGKIVEYEAQPVALDKTCRDIHGRYKIVVNFIHSVFTGTQS